MNENIEKEYKVLLNKKQFQTLLLDYPSLVFKKQVNTYYDTTNMDIQSIHGAMRIRTISQENIFTLKLRKGDDLYEYECLVPSNDVHVFEQKDIQSLLFSHHIYGSFHRLCELTTYRGMVVTKNAEICFDNNFFHNVHDYEIEYEYTHPHDGLHEFQKILDRIHITYKENCTSKIQRALASL